jgi:hypothetical protein
MNALLLASYRKDRPLQKATIDQIIGNATLNSGVQERICPARGRASDYAWDLRNQDHLK